MMMVGWCINRQLDRNQSDMDEKAIIIEKWRTDNKLRWNITSSEKEKKPEEFIENPNARTGFRIMSNPEYGIGDGTNATTHAP